jgi:hypothetical protein
MKFISCKLKNYMRPLTQAKEHNTVELEATPNTFKSRAIVTPTVQYTYVSIL